MFIEFKDINGVPILLNTNHVIFLQKQQAHWNAVLITGRGIEIPNDEFESNVRCELEEFENLRDYVVPVEESDQAEDVNAILNKEAVSLLFSSKEQPKTETIKPKEDFKTPVKDKYEDWKSK